MPIVLKQYTNQTVVYWLLLLFRNLFQNCYNVWVVLITFALYQVASYTRVLEGKALAFRPESFGFKTDRMQFGIVWMPLSLTKSKCSWMLGIVDPAVVRVPLKV
jgi:hypothetical protein